jgi:hypothetical protein
MGRSSEYFFYPSAMCRRPYRVEDDHADVLQQRYELCGQYVQGVNALSTPAGETLLLAQANSNSLLTHVLDEGNHLAIIQLG